LFLQNIRPIDSLHDLGRSLFDRLFSEHAHTAGPFLR
jgi:hypothetical protein